MTPPGHPECVERAHVFEAVTTAWVARGGTFAAPRPAARDDLERVHSASYLDRIAATAGRAVMLDPDTFTSPDSADVALLAAGASVQAAEHAVDNNEPAVALVRPPGHHAERDRAMGFCLYNNVAIAVAAMLNRGLQRIAIVDIDVHHGNGTQHVFLDDPRVLYVSSHQYPFYPGTGDAREVGEGPGSGFTVNVPMEAGSADADYDLVYRAVVAPILRRFGPELLLISAGYDAHESDPLASMRVTTTGYARMVALLRDAMVPHRAIALITEGGYELRALAACLEKSLIELDRPGDPQGLVSASRGVAGPAIRGERALAAVRQAQAQYWPGL